MPLRKRHAIEFGDADSGKEGQQAGKKKSTPLKDDQDDNRQQDDRRDQSFNKSPLCVN